MLGVSAARRESGSVHTMTALLRIVVLLLGVVASACAGGSERAGADTDSTAAPDAVATPTSQPTTAPTARATTPPATAAPSVPGREVATVTSVVDGDTIKVNLRGEVVTVRYIGMDTPETVAPNSPVQAYGPEATAANKRLVEGRTVLLEKDISETDRFGRLLRYVYVQDFTGETMVNAELVRLGFARVATFPPDVKYIPLFLELERAARASGAGLWSLPTATASPT